MKNNVKHQMVLMANDNLYWSIDRFLIEQESTIKYEDELKLKNIQSESLMIITPQNISKMNNKELDEVAEKIYNLQCESVNIKYYYNK
jgi:hypothetical protein